jgi:multiple sugar transport system permease protein
MTDTLEKTAPAATSKPRRRRRGRLLTRRDKIVLWIMVGIPAAIHLTFVWVPAVLSVLLSFTSWDGIGGISTIKWAGVQNYHNVFTNYPPFWPAIKHNLIWLAFFIIFPTVFGLLLAVCLDKSIRFSRIYQGILFMPVVLSLALVGFIWQLMYSTDQGFVNGLLGTDINWLGDSRINLWAIMVAASWRHTGYIMILYLAGLKSVDPSLREAAALDGAGEWQTFRSVVFPALRPINIVVLVVTVIESLRAFDIVYVTNKGTNGLELVSVLITNNILGEASRIGFGSALAVILLIVSLVFIFVYLTQVFREDRAR